MATAVKSLPVDKPGIEARGNGFAAHAKSVTLATDIPPGPVAAAPGAAEEVSGWNELLRLGHRYIEKFLTMLPIILEDEDPAAVHKMRIISRRLEQIISLVYAKPLPPYARKLRRRVRCCRHLLSDLADCDVLRRMAERSLARDPSQNSAAWQAVSQFIQRRRAKILPRVLKSVSRINFSSPCARVQRDLEENGATRRVYHDGKFQKLAPEKADKIMQQRILHSLAHLWRDFESLVQETREDPCEQVIHGVRIATKRLRHLVEVMKKLKVPGSPEVLVRLRELHRAIGEWHDMEVLEHMTSDLLVEKKFVREHLELAVQIEGLFLRNREIKKNSEEKFRRLTATSRDYREIKNWVTATLPGRSRFPSAFSVQPRDGFAGLFPVTANGNGNGMK